MLGSFPSFYAAAKVAIWYFLLEPKLPIFHVQHADEIISYLSLREPSADLGLNESIVGSSLLHRP